jgi:hypothetical protein
MLKHYVEFYYPGLLFSNSVVREIASRQLPVELPPGSSGFAFFDREEAEINGELLLGAPKNYSNLFMSDHYIYELA